MRRKKILSVVLIVFMVVSGCFGNYMGNIFNCQKVYAKDGENYSIFSVTYNDITYEINVYYFGAHYGDSVYYENGKVQNARIYTTKENIIYSDNVLSEVTDELTSQVQNAHIWASIEGVHYYSKEIKGKKMVVTTSDFSDATCDFASVRKLEVDSVGTTADTVKDKLLENCPGTIEVKKKCECNTRRKMVASELIFDEECILYYPWQFENVNLESVIFKKRAELRERTFEGCTNLKNVKFEKNVVFDGGDAFKNTNLEVVTFENNVTFNSSKKNFENTTQNCKTTYIFKRNVTNGNVEFGNGTEVNCVQFCGGNYSDILLECNIKSVIVQDATILNSNTFCKCNIKNIVLGDETNGVGDTVIKSEAFTNCKIDSFSIEKSGTAPIAFESGSVANTEIENMNLNAKVSFEEAALQYTTINNLYVNVDVDNNLGVCSSAKTSIGKNTTIKNIHFNYHDINKNVEWNGKKDGKVNQLISFPLGTTTDTSVNADNIYFYNPNFNYIKNSSYKRGNVGTTKIYYYGGTNCKDASGNMISMDTLMKKWVDGDTNCKLVSITGENFKVDYKDASLNWSAGQEIKFEDVLCVKQTISVDNLQQYTGITSVKDKDLSMSVDCKESGNTAYRILKKSDVSSLSTSNYNYQYDNSWYTQLTQKSDVLVEGDNKYLVEVGGCVHPLVISASSKQKKDDSKDTNKIEPTTTPKVVQTPEPTKTVKPTDAPQASVSPNVTEEPTVAPQPTGETDPNEEGKILQKKIKKASLELNVESKNSYFKLNYSMSDDVTPKEFVIYYSIKSNKNFKKIANVSGTVNTYSWTNASVRKNGTKVYFMVIALFENEDIISTKKTSNVVGKILLAPAKSAVIKQIGNAARITWKKSNSSHGYLLEMTFRNDANKKYTRKFKVKGMKKTTLNLSFNKISSLYRKKLGSGRIYFHKATVTAYYKDNRGLTYASKCKVKVK